MEAAEDYTIFPTVEEQGHLLHQHHDQLALLGTTMKEVLHVLHRLDTTSEGLLPRVVTVSQSPSHPPRSAMPDCPFWKSMMALNRNAVVSSSSGWNELVLRTLFHGGLREEVQTELG
jgi:hypothetical protein